MRSIRFVFALLFMMQGSFLSVLSAQEDDSFRVMTFNIRLDHAGDGVHNWRHRKEAAAGLLESDSVDIVGTQEVLKNQLDDLLAKAPAFAAVGVGRFDGKEAGEYSAVLYRKTRFALERSGNFWLSETPDLPGSKGWDAACERIATWAVFRDLQTNKRFLVVNTHFDHVGKLARKNSALMIVEKAAAIAGDLPVIITGDFNGTKSDEPVQIIMQSGWLSDAQATAAHTEGPDWSFHDFGRTPQNERQLIDFIFVSKHFIVGDHQIIFRQIGQTYLSDHNPVLAKIKLKP